MLSGPCQDLVNSQSGQLRLQMDKTKDEGSQLRTMQKEFDDLNQRSAPLWEQDMKNRDSKIPVASLFTYG